jgi:NAD(P)-dependent dehydrogenase (short-subunit alcohol dehydrogenase family)
MSGALDLFRLDGKVAVVTGGSKGIGMFYSQALAEAGASVVVADIDPVHVAQTSERLSKEHDGCILGVDLDVTSRDSIRAMVHQIDQRWGRLDILNWLQVFRRQKLLAAVIREANRGRRVQGGQKNA